MAASGFTIGLRQAKAGFFDRPAVQSATDRATNRNLSRFGAFVRTRSRSSIRRRKAVSEPGRPPSSHVGTLKKFIFFSFEPTAKSVVIGPTRTSGRGEAPALLEHGGAARFTPPRQRRSVTVRFQPRPFMTPAFNEEQKRLSPLWRDSVRK